MQPDSSGNTITVGLHCSRMATLLLTLHSCRKATLAFRSGVPPCNKVLSNNMFVITLLHFIIDHPSYPEQIRFDVVYNKLYE
jgi:hypothetical protein